MKKLKCKLIVSDFDGTLANSKNEVPPEVVEAINTYIADGGIFAVCTGRILPCILPRVRQLNLKGLVVASQGSTIVDIESGKVLRNAHLTCGQTAEICAVLEEMNTNVNMYDIHGFYTDLPEDDAYLKKYEEVVGVIAKRAEVPLSQFVAGSGIECNKVATLCFPRDRERLFAILKARLGDRYDVTCSASVLIEVSPFGETKGEALKKLAKYYSVPIEETCAVGDNLNDLSMLEAAGYGVAVANSAGELLERVKHVTASNDEGAVAKVIEEYGYCDD